MERRNIKEDQMSPCLTRVTVLNQLETDTLIWTAQVVFGKNDDGNYLTWDAIEL